MKTTPPSLAKNADRGSWAVLNPFQALDTRARAQEAAKGSLAAAIGLCVWNLLTAISVYNRPPRIWTLVPKDPVIMASVHVAVAAAAVAMAVILHKRRPMWAVIVMLIWGVAELIRPVTGLLYGHGAPYLLGGGIFFASILGLRGTLRLRKMDAETALS